MPFKKAEAHKPQTVPHKLRLYVAGSGVCSLRAVQNLTKMCEAELRGRYQLEVVDIYKDPQRAAHDRIIAIPTLIKEAPGMVTRMIGDLSKTAVVRQGLGLQEPA